MCLNQWNELRIPTEPGRAPRSGSRSRYSGLWGGATYAGCCGWGAQVCLECRRVSSVMLVHELCRAWLGGEKNNGPGRDLNSGRRPLDHQDGFDKKLVRKHCYSTCLARTSSLVPSFYLTSFTSLSLFHTVMFRKTLLLSLSCLLLSVACVIYRHMET